MLTEISKTVTELTSTEPVTTAEVKTHLNITDSAWDAEIAGLITQCRRSLEAWTGCSLIYKRVLLYCELSGEWWLPYGPVIGIELVHTKEGTIGSGIPAFEATTADWEISDGLFPKFYSTSSLRHKIQYTAGFTSSNFPPDLKLALLHEIYYRFENKGQTRVDGICDSAMRLASPYRRLEWL